MTLYLGRLGVISQSGLGTNLAVEVVLTKKGTLERERPLSFLTHGAQKKRPWQGCRGLVAPIVKSGVVCDCPMGRAAACYQGAGFASMPSTSVDAHPLATA
jgi:hypothetical protein